MTLNDFRYNYTKCLHSDKTTLRRFSLNLNKLNRGFTWWYSYKNIIQRNLHTCRSSWTFPPSEESESWCKFWLSRSTVKKNAFYLNVHQLNFYHIPTVKAHSRKKKYPNFLGEQRKKMLCFYTNVAFENIEVCAFFRAFSFAWTWP